MGFPKTTIKMADEDILPLLGVNIPEEDDGESESSGADDDDDEDREIRAIVNVTDEEEDSETQRESVSPRSAGDTSGRESSSGRRDRRRSQVQYDQSLPSTHSYLGEDMEDLHGRTIHDDDSWQRIPLLSFPGVVLIPGQVIPLQIFQPRIVSVLKRILQTDRTFGIVPMNPGGMYPDAIEIGTTAEIISIKEDNDDASGIDTMRVKAIGRQRFEIKETRREMDGSVSGRVRILAEAELTDPLEGARPSSHNRHMVAPVVRPITSIAVDRMGDYFKFQPTLSRKRLDRLSAAHVTWWLPWVYRLYDTEFLMTKIKQELTSWNETLDVSKLPEDAVTFSFWVASNVPLDDGMKSRLLTINSAVQRLRYELNILERYTILCCTNCDRQICNKKDIFTLAQEGPMGTYVNPGGYIHEMLTVLTTRGVSLRGRASEEHSWFPGYAWTIAECRYCSAHLGWQFTAANKKLKPSKFYGLTRASLTPGLVSADGDEDKQWVPVM